MGQHSSKPLVWKDLTSKEFTNSDCDDFNVDELAKKRLFLDFSNVNIKYRIYLGKFFHKEEVLFIIFLFLVESTVYSLGYSTKGHCCKGTSLLPYVDSFFLPRIVIFPLERK